MSNQVITLRQILSLKYMSPVHHMASLSFAVHGRVRACMCEKGKAGDLHVQGPGGLNV